MHTILSTSIAYLKKERTLSIRYLISVICTELAFLASPFVVAAIIDQIVQQHFDTSIYRYASIRILLSLIDEGASRCANTIRSSLIVKTKNNFSLHVLESIQKKDFLTLSQRGTGKLQKRIDNGIDAFISIFYSILVSGEAIVLRGCIIILILLRKAPAMILALIVIVMLIIITHRIIQPVVQPIQKRINTITELQAKQKTTMIMEYLFFRLWNANDHENNILHQHQSPLLKLEPKNELINELPFSAMAIGFRIRELGVYLYYGYQYFQGTISIGMIMALVTYIWWLRRPIQNLLNNMASFRKNINRRDRLQSLLNTNDTVKDGTEPYRYKNGTITINNLSFGYGKDDIFKGVSITFSGGSTTAIVGHSGSGKSTLIKLLLRLYDPHTGSLEIDGQLLSSLQKQSRYDAVGYISQDSSVIEGTIESNLLYGLSKQQQEQLNPEQLQEKLWRALEQAHLDTLIHKKRKGLQTIIGERGLKLSGGEKQKLALARLFLKNPPIIILDEPTSALDSLSEHHITESLKQLTKGKTVIIIAHRLQTVMHADHIIVMENGAIVEQGTHEDLMNRQGMYSTMVDLQHGILQDD